eukprot:COSAG01_NODE_2834_length_6995_cov_5.819751_7_plen_88_part_00
MCGAAVTLAADAERAGSPVQGEKCTFKEASGARDLARGTDPSAGLQIVTTSISLAARQAAAVATLWRAASALDWQESGALQMSRWVG